MIRTIAMLVAAMFAAGVVQAQPTGPNKTGGKPAGQQAVGAKVSSAGGAKSADSEGTSSGGGGGSGGTTGPGKGGAVVSKGSQSAKPGAAQAAKGGQAAKGTQVAK